MTRGVELDKADVLYFTERRRFVDFEKYGTSPCPYVYMSVYTYVCVCVYLSFNFPPHTYLVIFRSRRSDLICVFKQ